MRVSRSGGGIAPFVDAPGVGATLAMLGLVALVGCVPGRWSAYHYEDLKMASFWSDNLPPQTEDYAPYFVDGAFVRAAMRAHDQDETEGSPPYSLVINVYGVTGVHRSVTIHSVSVDSSLGNSYTVRPIESSPDGGVLRELSFPLQLTFHRMLTTKERVWVSMKTAYTLTPSPAKRETLVATIELAIQSRNGVQEGTVKYVFSPIYKEGSFTWYDPWTRR